MTTSDKTWRWKDTFATWHFRLPLPVGVADRRTFLRDLERRAAWLSAVVIDVLRALGDFGEARFVEVSTESRGEDAYGAKLVTKDEQHRLLEFIKSSPDSDTVDLDFGLLCELPEPTRLNGGASLRLELDRDDSGLVTDTDVLHVTLFLEVDIYSPRTFGDVRENHELAARNGPRLAGFLRRLMSDVGVIFHDVYAPGYEDLAGPEGFALDGQKP